MRYGWILLFLVALFQVLVGLLQLVSDNSITFENDTGVAWAELTKVFPTVAYQFSMAKQSSLVANIAVGLLSMAIIYFAFRDGQSSTIHQVEISGNGTKPVSKKHNASYQAYREKTQPVGSR